MVGRGLIVAALVRTVTHKGGNDFLDNYLDVAIFGLVAAGMVVVTLWISALLAPRRPYAKKLSTYECGEEPFHDARINFHIRYFVFALTFFVFDMEAIFLYPWAVVFRDLGVFAFVEMIIFLVILAVGLLYAWKKKVLQWV